MVSVIWVPTRHNLSSLSSNKWSGLTLICETEPHSISEQRIRNAVSWMKWPVHVSGSGGSLGEKVVSPIKSKCNYVAIHFRKARTLLESRAETQTHRPNRPWRLSILPSPALVPSAEAADKKKEEALIKTLLIQSFFTSWKVDEDKWHYRAADEQYLAEACALMRTSWRHTQCPVAGGHFPVPCRHHDESQLQALVRGRERL